MVAIKSVILFKDVIHIARLGKIKNERIFERI